MQAFATVCLTIDYAHKRNVIHRDLKPANIMLGDFGEVYVLDWGLARILDPEASISDVKRLSVPGQMMGTPLYMAPEQMADPDAQAQEREMLQDWKLRRLRDDLLRAKSQPS